MLKSQNLKGFEACLLFLKYILVYFVKIPKCFLFFHRITESQNGRGWKGPLWVI